MGKYGLKPRKDANHKDIVNACRNVGATVIDIAVVKNAFDIIVCYRGQTLCVEIKDGNKPPSARKLTSGELECKNSLESVGVNYFVINSVDEVIHLLNSL